LWPVALEADSLDPEALSALRVRLLSLIPSC
jgi:hypothetical protein